MSRPNWSQPLPRPIIVPDLLELTTLADVRDLIEKHRPAKYRAKFTWRQLAGLLWRVARVLARSLVRDLGTLWRAYQKSRWKLSLSTSLSQSMIAALAMAAANPVAAFPNRLATVTRGSSAKFFTYIQ